MSSPVGTTSLLSVRNLLWLVAWMLALFGVLQVHQLEGMFGHAICGPWGCGSPVSALIGYHAFWCLLIWPGVLILGSRWCRNTRRHLGSGLMLVSVAGIASLLLLDGLNNSAAERYLLRWCLFRVATFVDFPLVQLGIAGLWLRIRASRASVCHEGQKTESENDRRSTTETSDL